MQQDEKNAAENQRGQSAGAPGKDPAAVEQAAAAHLAAEHDIEEDPDLAQTEDPGADLDEGELARLDNSNDGGEEAQK